MRRACRSLGIATSGALPDPYPELLESGKGTYARKALSMRPVEPVGRASEFAALSEALDALGHGAPGCLAAEGNAGIGKTFLLYELRRLAEQRGHLVLRGSVSEFERDLPFGVFLDALDDYVASQMLDADGATDREWLRDLAGVLPALGRGKEPAAAMALAGNERQRAHRSMRSLLELLAE